MKCDLHVHSNCSDGIFSPEKLVETAKERGLDCIAITDHDTFEGVARAKKRAEEIGIKYLVGAELSSVGEQEVHILAYNVNIDLPNCQNDLKSIANMRDCRNVAMVKKLRKIGIDIDLDTLRKNGTVGRAVIAREMVRLKACRDVQEAFDKYIGADKPCYVQTRRLTPVEAIQFTLRYGGIPVLAHPKQLRLKEDEFEKFLKPLVLSGLGGIEAQYFTHNITERNYYGRLAKKYKLVVTGGSDFHDHVHGVELGTKSFSPGGYTRTILGI